MKFVAITLLAFVAAAIAGPISVSDNNVGDIVTVGINANLELSNHVEQNIISVILALLNQQALVVATSDDVVAAPPAKHLPELSLTPEMIAKAKEFLSKY